MAIEGRHPALRGALPSALDSLPSDARRTDVVVVGAGLSGLVAANRLVAAGASVMVLEARGDRVGGRVESAGRDGWRVDLGGAWIGATHARAVALADGLGVHTFPAHSAGEPVVINRARRMRGRAYKLRHLASTLDGRRAARRLDRLASDIDTDAPWAARDAAGHDSQTLDSWLASAVHSSAARRTLGGTLTNLLGVEPHAVSLLHALFFLRASGGFDAMLKGAQATLIHGGAQELADRLAEPLGDSLVLGAPVRLIEHGEAGVRVHAGRSAVEAGQVVVALAPGLAGRIAYEPGLPVQREQLMSGMPHGDVTKTVMVYDRPFWRDEGLSGEAWGDDLPFSFSYDMSPPDGSPGVLTLFFAGERARVQRARTSSSRRAELERALVSCFGADAAQPIAAFERDWAAEPWSRGAYCGYMPPGVWTRYGQALRAPVGPIVWAGSETALDHTGYMEGAIESGERAAATVLGTRERGRELVA